MFPDLGLMTHKGILIYTTLFISYFASIRLVINCFPRIEVNTSMYTLVPSLSRNYTLVIHFLHCPSK